MKVSSKTHQNLWRICELDNPDAAVNPFEARKWLDELHAEPDKGRAILTASKGVVEALCDAEPNLQFGLRSTRCTEEAIEVAEEADADLKASEEEAFLADQHFQPVNGIFANVPAGTLASELYLASLSSQTSRTATLCGLPQRS